MLPSPTLMVTAKASWKLHERVNVGIGPRRGIVVILARGVHVKSELQIVGQTDVDGDAACPCRFLWEPPFFAIFASKNVS